MRWFEDPLPRLLYIRSFLPKASTFIFSSLQKSPTLLSSLQCKKVPQKRIPGLAWGFPDTQSRPQCTNRRMCSGTNIRVYKAAGCD